MESVNPPLAEVQQVLAVCPHVDVDDVIRDLSFTGDAEETINRILDGTHLSAESISPVQQDQSHSPTRSPHQVNKPAFELDSEHDDDDGLPDMVRITNARTKKSGSRLPAKSNKTNQVSHTSTWLDEVASSSRENNQLNENYVTELENEDVSLIRTDHSLPSLEPSISVGRVDKWIQQSKLSIEQNLTNKKASTASSALENLVSTNRSQRSGPDGKTKRRISISSSESGGSESGLTNQDHSSESRTHSRLEPSSSSPTNMKRSCSPISVSDSDDDEDMLSLSLKITSASHLPPPRQYNGTSQSSKYSMDYDDSETMDSISTQQTYSSVETADSQDQMKKKKRKRTPEEIEEVKRKAMEKKRQKEAEREAKQREKDKEKESKKAMLAARKADRPEECMKYIKVILDPVLLEEVGGAAILTKLESLNSKYSIEAQPISAMVTWRRLGVGVSLGENIELQSMCTESEESEALVLLTTASFVDMVFAFKQEQQGEYCAGMESLRDHTLSLQRTLRGKQLTLIVMKMESYYKSDLSKKNVHNRQFRSAVLGAPVNDGKTVKRRKKARVEDITTIVSRVNVEEALVDLQLRTSCNVRFVEKPEEVAECIALFTKSVAETPFKRQRDKASFSFHVDNEWAGGVKVNKEGVGLMRVWRQQLQQFKNVSPEIASAIIGVYPSPRSLLQAYKRCGTISEKEKLLQDILIRRGEGALATSRRVGGVLSKRVHTQMTSHNGDLVL